MAIRPRFVLRAVPPRRLPRSCALALAAMVLAPAVAFAGDAPPSPSLRLDAAAARPGLPLALSIASPYPDRPCSIEILAPDGAPATLWSGRTGANGHVAVEARLAGVPGSSGLDVSLRAVVDSAGAGARASDWARRVSLGETTLDVPPLSLAALPDEIEAVAVAAVDLEGDGDDDVVFAGPVGLRIFVNDGAGVLTEETAARQPSESVVAARALAAADVDGDGDVDLFVATGAAAARSTLLLNDGAGVLSFSDHAPAKAQDVQENAAAFGDLDGDGDEDLVIVTGITGAHGAEPTLQANAIWINDGAGGFAVSASFAADDLGNAPAVSRAVALGDVDADGDLDIAIGNAGPNALLLNDGAGVFEAAGGDRLPSASDGTYGAAFSDFDLDGDLDLVWANTAFSPFAQALLLNQGGAQGGAIGVFAAAAFPAPVEGQSAVRLGLAVLDIDADGDDDVIFPTHDFGTGETPDLYVNQGGAQGGDAGVFRYWRLPAAPSGVYGAMAASDIDRDGDLDLVVPATLAGDDGSAAAFVLVNGTLSGNAAPLAFLRGDVNGDFGHDISDAVAILSYLFVTGLEPGCLAAADTDATGRVELTDAVVLLGHLFLGGAPLAAPFPDPGDAPDLLGLSCRRVPFVVAAASEGGDR